MRAFAAFIALSACVPPDDTPRPLTLPPADGRILSVVREPWPYDVSVQAMAQAQGRLSLRVSRRGGAELDYSDGYVARQVADDFCGQYNRHLNANAFGMFSAPASWVFEGGCL